MAHAAMAGRCPQFDHFLNVVLDEKLKQLLRTADFADALQWSSTFESVANSDEARLELGEMLLAVGASPEEAEAWLDQAMALYTLACDLGPSAHRRVGRPRDAPESGPSPEGEGRPPQT